MKVTTKQQIMNYLNYTGRWCSGSELEAQAEDWQTKSSVISRRARELANENRINRALGPKRTVQYASSGTFTTANEANSFIKSLDKELV